MSRHFRVEQAMEVFYNNFGVLNTNVPHGDGHVGGIG